jgi:hypothetical protein
VRKGEAAKEGTPDRTLGYAGGTHVFRLSGIRDLSRLRKGIVGRGENRGPFESIGYRVGWARAHSELDVTVRVGDWMLSACANLTLNLHLDLGIDVDGKLSY